MYMPQTSAPWKAAGASGATSIATKASQHEETSMLGGGCCRSAESSCCQAGHIPQATCAGTPRCLPLPSPPCARPWAPTHDRNVKREGAMPCIGIAWIFSSIYPIYLAVGADFRAAQQPPAALHTSGTSVLVYFFLLGSLLSSCTCPRLLFLVIRMHTGKPYVVLLAITNVTGR